MAEEPPSGFKRHTLPEHEDILGRAGAFRRLMEGRRSVREFSDRPVPEDVVRELIRTAGTAPSGANKQPWRFVAVRDPALKTEIRKAAEEEERLFYGKRASQTWLNTALRAKERDWGWLSNAGGHVRSKMMVAVRRTITGRIGTARLTCQDP